MRRRIVLSLLFAVAAALPAVPAAAACIAAPGLPGGGVAISCDGSPPNPVPAISGTDAGDSVSLDDGAAIDASPGFPSVDLGDGDDAIGIGDGVVLAGPVDGGPGDDELVFFATLGPAECSAAIAAIEAADPAAGSITIEGLVYEWSGFETLTPAFECLPITDVPALSWRGLLALGLLLAVLGIGVLRARL